MLFYLEDFPDALSGIDQIKLIDGLDEAALFIYIVQVFVDVCNVLIQNVNVYLVELRPCGFMLLALLHEIFQFIKLFFLQDSLLAAHYYLALFNQLILLNIDQLPIECDVLIRQFIEFCHHFSFHNAVEVSLQPLLPLQPSNSCLDGFLQFFLNLPALIFGHARGHIGVVLIVLISEPFLGVIDNCVELGKVFIIESKEHMKHTFLLIFRRRQLRVFGLEDLLPESEMMAFELPLDE
jgi:hypothetical protein